MRARNLITRAVCLCEKWQKVQQQRSRTLTLSLFQVANNSGVPAAQPLDPQNHMENFQQLCEKQHEQMKSLVAAQGMQIEKLQLEIAELQEHRRANQQPLREVTDTLVELTEKIAAIWEASKRVVVRDSKSMGRSLETANDPRSGEGYAGAAPVLDASKVSIAVGSQTSTAAVDAAPNIPITVTSPLGTANSILKSSTSTPYLTGPSALSFGGTWGTDKSLISGEPKAMVLAQTESPSVLSAKRKSGFTGFVIDRFKSQSGSKRKRDEADEGDGDRKDRKMVGNPWLLRGDDESVHDESDE